MILTSINKTMLYTYYVAFEVTSTKISYILLDKYMIVAIYHIFEYVSMITQSNNNIYLT